MYLQDLKGERRVGNRDGFYPTPIAFPRQEKRCFGVTIGRRLFIDHDAGLITRRITILKVNFVCPFTNKTCHECALYRGRHCYLDNHQKGRANISDSADIESYFQALEEALTPHFDAGVRSEIELHITLRVIDVENGTSSVCPLGGAKAWDWDNEQVMRIIDGRHITSWDTLVDVLSYKAEKGYQEVKLYEAPRFMVLAGG